MTNHNMITETQSAELVTCKEAMRVLKLSREFLYTLPTNTPGVYKFGKAKRFDIQQLKAWASHELQ